MHVILSAIFPEGSRQWHTLSTITQLEMVSRFSGWIVSASSAAMLLADPLSLHLFLPIASSVPCTLQEILFCIRDNGSEADRPSMKEHAEFFQEISCLGMRGVEMTAHVGIQGGH